LESSAEFGGIGEIRTGIPCYSRKIPPRKQICIRGGAGQWLACDGNSDYVGFHIHEVAIGIFEIGIGTEDLDEIFLRAPAVGLAAFGVGERRASLTILRQKKGEGWEHPAPAQRQDR